jgi:hypothetical protein
MTTTNVPMMFVILKLDVSMLLNLAMTTMHAPKMFVIQKKDAFTLKSNVTMELIAPKIVARKENVSMNTFTLNVLLLTNALLDFAQITDANSKKINLNNVILMSRKSAKNAKLKTNVKKLLNVKSLKILLQNASFNQRTVMTRNLALKTLVTSKLENAFTPKSNPKNVNHQFAKTSLTVQLGQKKNNSAKAAKLQYVPLIKEFVMQ